MGKRTANKALRDLIAKLVWQTEKVLPDSWRYFFFFFSSLLPVLIDCVVMIFLFATPNSLLPRTLLWCILCPASYIPSPLTTSLWLRPCDGLGSSCLPGVPEAWEYLLLFPCLIPQHWHLKKAAGPPSIIVSSSLQMSGEWSLEAWKRDGNQKAMQIKLLSTKPASVFSFPIVLRRFHSLPVLLHPHPGNPVSVLKWLCLLTSFLFELE